MDHKFKKCCCEGEERNGSGGGWDNDGNDPVETEKLKQERKGITTLRYASK